MEHRKWRWVSRDDGEDTVDVWFGDQKPQPYEEDGVVIFEAQDNFLGFSFPAFVAITGIDIKPGQCIKIEFTAKVLE